MDLGRSRWGYSLAAVLLFLPQLATASEITSFNGSITDVGIQRGPGQIGGVELRIQGSAAFDGNLDLSTATVLFDALFAELGEGGAGELLKTVDGTDLLPLTVFVRPKSQPDAAVFDTPRSFRPQFRFQVRLRKGSLDFRLKVDRGLMRDRPQLCSDENEPKTDLMHSFTFDDGVNPPVWVSGVVPWECTRPGRYHMRSRFGARGTSAPEQEQPRPETPPGSEPQPEPEPRVGNQVPNPNLVVIRLTGNLFQLDGSNSGDRDGTIVRYRFESGDGRLQDGPSPTARFLYAPGEYVASLSVVDDRGAVSKTETRRFSVTGSGVTSVGGTSPPATPSPTPSTPTAEPPRENQPPKASLATVRLTEDFFQLDGTSSEDRDGTIVRYRFESGDGRVQDGASPTARFLYAPGEYVATLSVTDDRGAVSDTETRRFTVRGSGSPSSSDPSSPAEPSTTATPPPSTANQPPKANLATVRLSGALYDLDGTNSEDRDGSIVGYRFESGDGRVQDGPSPTARFLYAPGEYVATLSVTDDRGAVSDTEMRRFTVR